ncbi:MAG: squalene/phytoene synthase family protein [Candidatus Eiseniibacteriota bacterium]
MAFETPSPADWHYCRAVLPRVSRTFAINIRVLGSPLANPVRIAYLLCRACDTLEDSWPGPPGEIRQRFEVLRDAVDGDSAAAEHLAEGARAVSAGRQDLALLGRLPAVLRCYGALDPFEREVISDCVAVMSRGMCHYAARDAEWNGGSAALGPPVRAYLESEAELHDYCWVVAGCVGVMLTRLFGRLIHDDPAGDSAGRLERAPVLGEALQLTNILLDWPSDVRRGRCFLPAAWLAEWNLTPRDLVGSPRPGQRELLERLEILARRALAVVPEYLERVPRRALRYRLFCLWPALWAAASIGRARREPEFPWGERRPRLSRTRLWSLAAGSLIAPAPFSRAFRPPAN